jgi:hypothetical protein
VRISQLFCGYAQLFVQYWPGLCTVVLNACHVFVFELNMPSVNEARCLVVLGRLCMMTEQFIVISIGQLLLLGIFCHVFMPLLFDFFVAVFCTEQRDVDHVN